MINLLIAKEMLSGCTKQALLSTRINCWIVTQSHSHDHIDRVTVDLVNIQHYFILNQQVLVSELSSLFSALTGRVSSDA